MGEAEFLEATARLEGIMKQALHGQHPLVQGAVIANVISIWVVGHPPEVREEVLRSIFDLASNLLPVTEFELFGPEGHPQRKNEP